MRLLIAEDELDLAEVLTAFLEKNQYTVDAVHDGAAALDYALTGWMALGCWRGCGTPVCPPLSCC